MGGRRLDQPLLNDNYLDKLIRRSRERSNTLGDLCKWDMEGVEIPPDTLFKILTAIGMEKWTPVPINPKTAARKAITRIKHMLEDPENNLKIMSRRVNTAESDVVRYAIVEESVDLSNLDLDYSTVNQVLFRKDTETLEFTGNPVPELVAAFDYLCSVYTDAELKQMVKNIVNNHGCIWLNDKSGMVFIGRGQKADLVEKMLKLFDELQQHGGPGGTEPDMCYFRPIAILDDEENRKVMGDALIADIGAELHDATEYLDRAIADDSKKSLNAALQRFRVAKAKGELYEDMLTVNMEGIRERIEEANAKAAELMTKLAEGKSSD